MDNAVKVCLLSDSFPPSVDGVANCVLNYAQIIQKEYGCAVVAAPSYPKTVDEYPFQVVRYPSINTTKSVGYRTGLPYWPSSFRELIESEFSVIHTHCPFMSTLQARTLRSSINVPIVLTYHTKYDIDIKNAVELGFLQTAAIKFIVSNIEACDEVWVVSEGAGENLRSLGYKGGYRVMENGVDFPKGRVSEEAVRQIGEEYMLEPGVPVFLYVGRMMWYKGIRIILDGLFKAKERGARFKMLFVGDGPDCNDIKELARMLKLTDDCIFTGVVKDRQKLRAFFSRADMFLFPSTFDTNGIVVREAAACGLASVLVRGSSAAEGIADGRCGVLISEDADAMAGAVINITADVTRAHRMGQNAMEALYLSWEDAVGRACRRYPDVVEDYRKVSGDRVALQDKKLYKLATDVNKAFEKLKNYREWQRPFKRN